jgi:hypothetical protein
VWEADGFPVLASRLLQTGNTMVTDKISANDPNQANR